jgi:hypothetical protein
MVVYANATPAPAVDAAAYCINALVPANEADLGAPLSVAYGQALAAVVELTVSGGPASNSSYVICQTDAGDNVWVDVAWAVWTGTSGTAVFLLSAGTAGAGAVQQQRAANSAPASSGSIQAPLLGRVRFTAKAVLAGGVAPAVTATIRAKLLGLR